MFSILGLIMLILGIWLVFKLVGTIAGLLIALLIAGVIGFAAEALVPGDRMPGGWLAAIGAGLVGSWAGPSLFGVFGPIIAGFAILPAILGAAIVVVVVTLLNRSQSRVA